MGPRKDKICSVGARKNITGARPFSLRPWMEKCCGNDYRCIFFNPLNHFIWILVMKFHWWVLETTKHRFYSEASIYIKLARPTFDFRQSIENHLP
jgi:hypothetical protein